MRGIDRRGGMSKNSTHCRAGEMPLQYLVFYELLVLERLHLLSLQISPITNQGRPVLVVGAISVLCLVESCLAVRI